MMKLIISELEHNQYDAIHCEGLQTAYYALKLTRITHKPVIIRFHNIESQISYRFANVTRNWFTKFFLYYESILTKRLENKVYRHIRNILFITEQDFKSALTIHSKTDHNYFISPAGVDIDFFTPHQALSDDIIFLGSMDWKPNEDAVLWFHQHVISEILNRYKHVKFYIVGKNPSLKIRKLETERVIVTGTVPDVRPFIKRTGIAVVPLRIGGGMRVKILEMMACGMPVISTGLGAEGIDCNDRHNLFIAETKEDFVNRISELIDQPELKEAISKEARITVENNYSWNTKMRELEKYYQKFFQTQ